MLAGLFAAGAGPAAVHAADDAMYLDGAGRYADIVTLTEKEFAEGAERGAARLGWLCIAYSKVRRYANALKCADELDARVARGDTTMSGRYFGMEYKSDARPVPDMVRADAFVEFGRYADAIKAGERALTLADQDNPDATWSQWPPKRFRVLILGTLVIATSLQGDKKRAAEYLQVLDDTSIPYVGAPIVMLNKRNSLARAYLALGQYEKALDNLEATVTGTLGLGILSVLSPYAAKGDSLADQTEIPRMMMRAKALSELGRLDEAKAELDPILAHPRIKDMGDLHWLAQFERGRIAEKESDGARAATLYAGAIDVIEQQRATINSEASKIGFVGDKQAVYERLIALLVEQQRVADAFEYVERSKARALVDLLASKKDFAAPGGDPEKTRLILAQLDAADLAGGAQPTNEASGERRGIRELEVLRREIRQTSPELSSLVTVTTAPPDELKALIAEDEALLEYYYQGKELYVFVLRRDRLTVARLDAEGLGDAVQSFRSALQDPGSDNWRDAARALHARLWQPVEASIGASRVIVVAHGVLHYLSFAALMGRDGKLLIDQYSLRFLPSASVLKYLKPPVEKKEGLLLALGNPDLGDARLDLKFAEDEARTVAKLFPQSRLLVRKDASESNLKKAGGVFSRIHFATHGKFEADEPLNSGLYLAKDAENDGVLTVSELYSMRLDTDLVTLSACETGLGKVANGDDVVGLTRGFLYAGARSIVAS
ncbi:MAG TPA: CHAT domain-containing protein, partial [Methylocystis sp.]|nr:CHAT domain-containing protein [Methylocystis sp.]